MRRVVKPAGKRLVVLTAMLFLVASCRRDAAPSHDTAARSATTGAQGVHPAYDADSAARGLLPPELASLLAVEPLLARAAATDASQGRWCKEDTLPQLRHVRMRFDVRNGDTATTVFARRTPQGELRRSEVLRRLPDGSALGASWDADQRATTISEFGGGTVKKTTSADDDAPLAHALRYVGRRALATKCGTG